MILGFESYSPQTWSDAEGLMLAGQAHKVVAHPKQRTMKRMGKWNVIVAGAMGGACLAISSLLLLPPNSAVTTSTLAADSVDVDAVKLKTLPAAHDPTKQINKSFDAFFESVRTGKIQIPSKKVQLLARKALDSQRDKLDSDTRARQIASDIKHAND